MNKSFWRSNQAEQLDSKQNSKIAYRHAEIESGRWHNPTISIVSDAAEGPLKVPNASDISGSQILSLILANARAAVKG